MSKINEEIYEDDFIEIKINNGIMFGRFKVDYITYDIAVNAVKQRCLFSKTKEYPFIIHIESVKKITKEARDYLASEEGCKRVTHSAIIVNNYITKIIGNFFISISKPIIPTKLFNNKEDAISWISRSINR